MEKIVEVLCAPVALEQAWSEPWSKEVLCLYESVSMETVTLGGGLRVPVWGILARRRFTVTTGMRPWRFVGVGITHWAGALRFHRVPFAGPNGHRHWLVSHPVDFGCIFFDEVHTKGLKRRVGNSQK